MGGSRRHVHRFDRCSRSRIADASSSGVVPGCWVWTAVRQGQSGNGGRVRVGRLCEQSVGSVSVRVWGRRTGPLPSTRFRPASPDPQVRAGTCPAPLTIAIVAKQSRDAGARRPLLRRRCARRLRGGHDDRSRGMRSSRRRPGSAEPGGGISHDRASTRSSFRGRAGPPTGCSRRRLGRRPGRLRIWRTGGARSCARSTLAFVLVRASDPRRRDPLCPIAEACPPRLARAETSACGPTQKRAEFCPVARSMSVPEVGLTACDVAGGLTLDSSTVYAA